LFPDLTNFEQDLPVQRTEVTALGEDYQQPSHRACAGTTVTADLQMVYVLTGLAIGKQSTFIAIAV
jgi:hypothetical protein